MRISDWSSDVCSSDLDGLRCVDAGVDLLEQRADHACAPRIAIEFPQRIQAVLMPQDPAEYAILCTQADADDAPAIGKSVLQQAMQIPGLMRSEERRGGKEWVRTGRSGGAAYT